MSYPASENDVHDNSPSSTTSTSTATSTIWTNSNDPTTNINEEDSDRVSVSRALRHFRNQSYTSLLLGLVVSNGSEFPRDVESYLVITLWFKICSLLKKHPRLQKFASLFGTILFICTNFIRPLFKTWLWLIRRVLPHITIPMRDSTLHKNVLDFVANRILLDFGKKYSAESATHARNASAAKVANVRSVVYNTSSSFDIVRYGWCIFLLTKQPVPNSHVVDLTIWGLGYSTKSIRALINAASGVGTELKDVKADTRRPCKDIQVYSPGEDSYDGEYSWRLLTTAYPRSMESVVMPAARKRALIRDIELYPRPDRALRYANLSKPYRRSYLLYGPPGTGKTSFAMALASTYHLDVYQVSLLDENMNDAVLLNLFQSVRKGCLV